MADENESNPEHPLQLIPELCRLFYSLGWVTGTGGGVSLVGEDNEGKKYYIAPSGVQKERMLPEHIFIMRSEHKIIRAPPEYKPSQCTPLFFNAFDMRDAKVPLFIDYLL